jgi:hypothetical protein
MSSTAFTCTIDTTDVQAQLGLEIWLDDLLIYNTAHVTGPYAVNYEFEDDNGEHELRFIMKNKTTLHTQIDATGNIVSDACITIKDVAFDEIELGHVFVAVAQYTHNFNGTQPEITEPFYGTIGCNGTVKFEFTSPVYLWLLEHM